MPNYYKGNVIVSRYLDKGNLYLYLTCPQCGSVDFDQAINSSIGFVVYTCSKCENIQLQTQVLDEVEEDD